MIKMDSEKMQDVAIKALAVVGLLALLAIGSFTIISLARYAPGAFSYLASAAVSLSSVFISGDSLILKVDPVAIKSGENITLSWEHRENTGAGSYTISYPCLDGFYFEADTIARGKETIFCNTPFNFVNMDNSILLKAVSTENRYVDMPITVAFTKNGEEKVTDSSTITITVENANLSNGDGPITSKTEGQVPEAPRNTVNANTGTAGTPENRVYTAPSLSGATEDSSGKPDLKVVVLEVGAVDKITGTFTKPDTLKRSDRIAVRFAVENSGTKSSGEWRFNAILPTYPPYTFNSDTQPTLRPRDKIEYTIGFDQSVEGTQTVKIVIDPQGAITELLEDNNAAEVSMQIL